jgi:hypothetical protein
MEQIAKRIFDDEYWGGSRVTFEGWDGLNDFEKLAAKTFAEGIENTGTGRNKPLAKPN